MPDLRLPLPPADRDPANVRRRIDRMEYLLERAVRIPGTDKRLGLDVILDFVPVGGSVVAAGMGAWIAWEARNLGVSKWTVAKMGANIGVDMLLGAIPFVGAIPDYFFRSNTRNLRLLRRWLDEHHPAESSGAFSETRPR
ncbi:MAG TPA: DUF4112 domain-containing protein [Allosphingosinicella sp.]|jgi:hypothetical protein|nr:DUF4112 domain-containing protein [Allosphingosinicella sp.]